MKERLHALQQEAVEKINDIVDDLKQLNEIRVSYLGKKGPITEVLKGMGALSAEERPKVGAIANEVRAAIQEKLEQKTKEIEEALVAKKLAKERGCKAITLDSGLPRVQAHGFYEHYGFEKSCYGFELAL